MINPATTSGQARAEESRLELAVAASAAERANRPRWIIVLGSILLLASLIYTLSALSSRSSMFGKIEGERTQTRKVLDLKATIEAETVALARKGTAPDPSAGQKIEQYALQSGITLGAAVTDTTRAANSSIGMRQHVYTARATNQDPLAVLNWLKAQRDSYDTSGLEITRLRLSPGGGTAAGTAGWNVDVEFARWEKLPK